MPERKVGDASERMATALSVAAITGMGESTRSDFPPGTGSHLIASGLVGEPTAPVIGIAGATNMNS